MKKIIIISALLLILPSCQMKSALMKPIYEEGTGKGRVFLYVQPFQQESDRLRFSLEDISALKDDGSVFPLSLSISEFKGRDLKRQRLVASGWLPPGHYTGFSFKARDASLEVEDGEAALLVPEGPVKAEFLFDISRDRSYVVSLVFNYPRSLKGKVSFSPEFSVFSPERPVIGLLGYAVNYGSNNITVFDKKTMQAIGAITTGKGPSGIALAEDLKKAYVTLSEDDSVDVIDIAAGDVMNSIKLNTGDKPRWPVLTPSGKLLITANAGSDTISLIDPVSMIELGRIPVGNSPNSILIDPAGRRAYVFNTISNTISVIDIANRTVAAEISTEPSPLRGQFNREGNRLFVIHEWSSYLTVIDPFTLSQLNRVRVGMGAKTLKLDTRTNLLYLGKKDNEMVEVYDPFSFVPIDYVKGDESAAHISIDGEGNNLYLVIPGMKTIMIIDIVSKKVLSRIDVGEDACCVAMMGER